MPVSFETLHTLAAWLVGALGIYWWWRALRLQDRVLELQEMIGRLAARVAAQSDLLSRRAEGQTALRPPPYDPDCHPGSCPYSDD